MSETSSSTPAGMPVAQVAKRLGCSKQKIYNLIEAGYLEVFPGPGLRLVTTASWERYLDSAGPITKTRESA